ncbi:hypothetical protein HYY75_10040 [bacterium]|nr:hypothetical protein [bacterium]
MTQKMRHCILASEKRIPVRPGEVRPCNLAGGNPLAEKQVVIVHSIGRGYISNMGNETIVYPQSLPEAIFAGLQDTDEISRLLALEEIAAYPLSPEDCAKIDHVRISDASQNCRDKAQRVIDSQIARKAAEGINLPLISPDAIYQILSEYSPETVRWYVKIIRGAMPPEAIDLWRKRLYEDPSPRILEIGLTFLSRWGDMQDVGLFLIHGLTSAEFLQIALDFFRKKAPEFLNDHVEKALKSEDDSLHLAGIRAFREFDPEAALLHLEVFLHSPDSFTRQKGLRELVFFPFEISENALLTFLSNESYQLLLVVTSVTLAMNPHPTLPEKIYEIALSSHGIKAQILMNLVKQTVESIHQSGILTEPAETFIANLKKRLSARKAKRVIEFAIRNLKSHDPEIRSLAVNQLSQYADYPEVREALEAVRNIDEPEAKSPERESVSGSNVIIEEITETRYDKLDATISFELFKGLSQRRQIDLLRTIKSSEAFFQVQQLLRNALKAIPDRHVISRVIELFGKFGNRESASELVPFLKNSSGFVVSQAIRSLMVLDQELLLPLINRLLKEENTVIKVAAIEFFLQADKESAIGILRGMLSSANPKVRTQALSLMPRLDTISAMPMLCNFILHERLTDLFQHAGNLIVADLTWEGALTIREIADNQETAMKAEAAELWKTVLQVAVPLLTSNEDEFKKILEQKSRQRAKAIAGFAKTKAIAAKSVQPVLPTIRDTIIFIWGNWRPQIIGFMAFVLISIVLWPATEPQAENKPAVLPATDSYSQLKRSASFAPGKMVKIQGEINRVVPGAIDVILDDDNQIMQIKLTGKDSPQFTKGTPLRGMVKLTTVAPKQIVAELFHVYSGAKAQKSDSNGNSLMHTNLSDNDPGPSPDELLTNAGLEKNLEQLWLPGEKLFLSVTINTSEIKTLPNECWEFRK